MGLNYVEMFYDEQENERRSRRNAWCWVAIYAIAIALLLLFVEISQRRDMTTGNEGVMIALGDTFEASSGEPETPEAPPEDIPEEEMLTQDHEDAPQAPVRPPVPRRPPPVRPPVPRPPTPRRPDPNALFPGQTAGSSGTGEGEGRQGAANGSPDGSPTGTGQGTSGDGWSLKGRRLVGALPKPANDFNKEGKVVVEITVNGKGEVTRAIFRAMGSTTNDQGLVSAALEAARRAPFDIVEGAPEQKGTITYNFRLK